MRWKNENGQALILAPLRVVVLIAFVVLGVDTEISCHEKRVSQGVASRAISRCLSTHFNLHDATITA